MYVAKPGCLPDSQDMTQSKLWSYQSLPDRPLYPGERHSIACSSDARDAGAAWDLRCEVREKLIQFLQETYPHGLPRVRTEFQEFPAGSVNPSSQPLARAASIKRGT